MKELRHHRSKCAARHNDGAFSAERPSGTDGDCSGQWFQNRELRFYRSAFQQNGFDGFRYSMPANSFGSISGKEPNNDGSQNGNEDDERSEMMMSRGSELSAEPLIKEKIGKQANQPKQQECDVAAENADADGEKRDPQNAPACGEVAEFFRLIRVLARQEAFPDSCTRGGHAQAILPRPPGCFDSDCSCSTFNSNWGQ